MEALFALLNSFKLNIFAPRTINNISIYAEKIKMQDFQELYQEAFINNLASKLASKGITEQDIHKLSLLLQKESKNGQLNENIFRKGWDWLVARAGMSNNPAQLAQQAKQVKSSLNSFRASMQRMGMQAPDFDQLLAQVNQAVDTAAVTAQQQAAQQQQQAAAAAPGGETAPAPTAPGTKPAPKPRTRPAPGTKPAPKPRTRPAPGTKPAPKPRTKPAPKPGPTA
jgi:hypothetical protein